ncbi:probable 125 kDa kinesin-related protein [Phtheirospermum japonicum]|uniref:Probable 125 kDa kinesin-related protein n=1 Tax=Phtheirospermum japonicum TaxID=374723 RepID=A0A830CVL7_9LAMI|nr:probable 125 kDa kinesin-related protein [Phtheirospermum japonicum]
MAPSPTPFYTPRPERRRPDSRGSDWNSNRQDKDKEVNIQVLLRCRPLADDEQRLNVPRVITCNDSKREVTVSQNVASKQVDRVFTFDKVFGPKAQQRSIYDQSISPIVKEVLDGFNCTVFAYGQTGTGKTYTMEGGMRKNKGGELPVDAGIIPRAVRQIFDTLEAQNADYSMKVTFSELYNEEITDLLAPEEQLKSTEENKSKKPISLMEDGKGCVIVRGLEEEAVYSANEIYSLLERGASRRRTADTLLNKRSSRSHSIFTITVHIKEGTIGDDELIKCGKLNLVDLAGSENIYRSGARESRAREAGEINKSLLTLGRVINALVEHSVHVPYRDSKLTRLLRDSLGGKTKTCIIATISPSAHCLDETLSTLDYAHRAKSIKNKPEANQKVSKAVLLKDIYVEIERMKQDIRAAREKNGVYIPHERFTQEEAEKKVKNERIEQLESDLNVSEKQLDKYRELYLNEQEEKLNVESELKDCKKNLETTHKSLEDLQENYKRALSVLAEKESHISKLQYSESNLIDCAKMLRLNLQDACEDISALFGKIDHKDKLERENQNILHTFGAQIDQNLNNLHKIVSSSVSQQKQQLRSVEKSINLFLASKHESNDAMEANVKKLLETYASGSLNVKKLTDALHVKASSNLEEMTSMISVQATAVENFFENASLEAKEVMSGIHDSLNEQRKMLAFSAQQQAEGLRQSLFSAQVISSAAINFSNELHSRASELAKFVERSQTEKCLSLQNFEKTFKEESAREEKLAMEKISEILSALTVSKTDRVSKASRSFEDSASQESKRLLVELSDMQQVLTSEMKELNEYEEKAKDHYMGETFSSNEHRAVLENCLHECCEQVDRSGQQWQNAQLGVSRLNKNGVSDIKSAVQTKALETHSIHENIVSASSCLGAEFGSQANDLMTSINDSLVLDKENNKEINSITLTSLNQLKSLTVNHSEHASDIRNRSEQCIHKDYLVEQKTNTTPKKRAIPIPSSESIEKMRALTRDVDAKNKIKCENKILQDQLRTPFQDVNGVMM